jgi:hypothetical protein
MILNDFGNQVRKIPDAIGFGFARNFRDAPYGLRRR